MPGEVAPVLARSATFDRVGGAAPIKAMRARAGGQQPRTCFHERGAKDFS